MFLVPAVLLSGSLLLFSSEIPEDEVTQEGLRFTKVYGLVEEHFMDPLDPDRAIFDGGIRGMLAVLDPFSAFFDPKQFEQLKQQAQGKSRGFGSILYVQPGNVLILQTAEGSPSRRAGLGPGDEIVEVNGVRIDRLDFPSLIDLLQQARSQRVRLGVVRPGRVVAEDFELNPAEVDMPTVDKAFHLMPDIGYIRLSGFDQKTPREVRDALNQLEAENLKGLLLDLRDNPGGVLESAIGVANLFLPPDLHVLTARGRAFPEKVYRTLPAAKQFDAPLIVLVSGNTASAAEVLAAALQEHDRALMVGEATFGKGVVETVTELSEKTGLALTTAQYLPPSGRSIQRPLPGTALATTHQSVNSSTDNSPPEFRTAGGRPVTARSGVSPDISIPARHLNPWVVFLNQRGVFTSFASHFLTVHGRINHSFEADAKALDEFRNYLNRQRILSPQEHWNEDYLKLRIKTEVLNLVFGLSVGEEVELRNDPQIEEAARLFPEIGKWLEPPAKTPSVTPARHRKP